MSPKNSSSSSPRFCGSRLAPSTQEGGPEAADPSLPALVRPPAAPYSCYRVPGPAHPQQHPQSARLDQGNPGCFPGEACRNITRASSRKCSHNTWRGQRLLKMQMSRKPAREKQHRLSLPPLPALLQRNSLSHMQAMRLKLNVLLAEC